MNAMAKADKLATAWWFGDLVIILICGGILTAAVLMNPSPSVLTLFGVEIPTMCGFRNITGYSCPGCGMTRAFVFMAHGMPIEAFKMNFLGPFLFTACAGLVPWHGWTLWKRWRRR